MVQSLGQSDASAPSTRNTRNTPVKLAARTPRASLTSGKTPTSPSSRSNGTTTPSSPSASRAKSSLGASASPSLLRHTPRSMSKLPSTKSPSASTSKARDGSDGGASDADAALLARIGYEARTISGLPSDDKRTDTAIVWLDIDNTLYKRSTKIAELMGVRIRSYFLGMGLGEDEAKTLHHKYYTYYGLAIRGLVKHHQIDPLDYDKKCDASLPLEDILRPDPAVKRMLSELDRTKVRVYALTNAYKYHARRCLRLLELDDQVEGIVYCDYAVPDFACKPELDYYRAALLAVGAKPGVKHYFVDDSSLNVVAAKKLGWHSCVYFREEDEQDTEHKSATFDATSLIPSTGGASAFDEQAIKQQLQKLPTDQRLRLLSIVLDACHPNDVAAMSKALEKHLWSTRDIISNLPDPVSLAIFSKLSLQDLLRCRQVSRKWLTLAATHELWRSHALALTEGDPVSIAAPSDPSEWETLVKGLFFRERNWNKGLAQSIQFLHGHTGFVTSMKLKGSRTLVSGSYDETIRVWDISTGNCSKVLQAKAISCLDFLEEEGVLCAGLYDTGRVMVWDMKTWDLIQTLSGHNKGIRNVAINSDYLVSVGQDKAIVVWDWRTGNKIARFGQQSNVSLGVSLVDKDKLVATTVDGIIRCFSITKREMIGQFQLAKLGGPDSSLSSRLGDLANGTATLEWFAAHGNTMTVASKNLVIHLEWQEHVVSAASTPLSQDGLDKFAALRLTNGTTTTLSPLRPQQENSASVSSNGTPTSATIRARKDSNASTTSTASTMAGNRSSPRRSLVSSSANSPTASMRTSRSSVGGPDSPVPMLSTPSRPRISATMKKPSGPAPWPLAADDGVQATTSSPMLSTKSRSASIAFPTLDHGNIGSSSTRHAPNLSVAPRVVSVLETPDMATGAVDPIKRRIVSSTRFNTRSGCERQLYTSSLPLDLGTTSADIARGATQSTSTTQISPIKGAWTADAAELSQPNRNPMTMVLDHESVVVGCADGCIYRIHFVGSKYDVEDSSTDKDFLPVMPAEQQKVGDVTIDNLLQLRHVWSDIFVPSDATNHPGRLKAT